MAYFYRLISCLAFGLLAFVASAAIPQVSTPFYYGSDGVHRSSLEAVVSAMYTHTATAKYCNNFSEYWQDKAALCQAATPPSIGGTGYGTASKIYYVYDGAWNFSGSVTAQFWRNVEMLCPANSTLSGGSCVCNATFVEEGASCVAAPPEPTVQELYCQSVEGQTTYATVPGSISPGGTACGSNGCGVTFGGMVIKTKTGGIVTGSQGDAVFTSSVCVASPDTLATPTECKGSQGEVNGVTVCVPFASTDAVESNKETTKTTVDANGVETVTTTTTNTNCDGAGSCVTTTTNQTSVGGGAATTTTDTTQEPRSDFCKDNPNDPQCGELDSAFGGDCGAPPVCSGDPILCAVAIAAFEMNCTLQPEEITGTEVDAYNTAKTVSGDQSADLEGNSAFSVGPGELDQSNMLGGGGSLSDVSFTVMGKTMALPFAMLNVWLSRLGLILQACAFLVAAYIVTGSRQGSA